MYTTCTFFSQENTCVNGYMYNQEYVLLVRKFDPKFYVHVHVILV